MVIDEVILVNILRNICLAIDTIVILIGLDLIIGAPVVSFINKMLNKVIDFDKSLNDPKARISLGFFFMIVAGAMMYVTLKAR